jgi:hypothetical protein
MSTYKIATNISRMACQLFFVTWICYCSAVFGQEIDLTGTWKQPRSLHVRNYTFKPDLTFQHNEYGDLSESHLTGHYFVRKDSIILEYDSTVTYQLRNFKPVNDTLIIINKYVIQVHRGLFVFHEERGPAKYSVYNDTLDFKIRSFGDTMTLQQERFNKWISLDTFTGTDSLEIAAYPLPLHSGINTFRILSNYCRDPLQIFEVNSTLDPVKMARSSITSEIHFNRPTYFELYNSVGTLILKDFGDQINCRNLPRGKYVLNYDNTWTEIHIK